MGIPMIPEKQTKAAKTIQLKCSGCNLPFLKVLRDHKRAIRRGSAKAFCSVSCRQPRKMINCACGKSTTNPNFCSTSCAARINNSLFPKRHRYRVLRVCRICNVSYFNCVKHAALRTCAVCLTLLSGNGKLDFNSPIGSALNTKALKGRHPSWKFAHIRQLNRRWNCHLLKLPCARCGYTLHIELAHIKPLASFPLSATIGEVNNPSNIIQLCRNCHWEFDHQIFTIAQTQREPLVRIELTSFHYG